MNRFKQLIFVGAICVAAMAHASDGFTIHQTQVKGEVLTYKIHAVFDANGQAINFDALSQSTVTQVNSDGSYAVKRKLLNGSLDFGGRTMALPATPSQTYDMSDDGSLIKIEGMKVNPKAVRAANLESMIDPDKTVNIGDTWTRDYKTGLNGSVAAHAEFKVIDEETIDGEKTLKIQGVVSETGGNSPGSDASTIWLRESDWVMVKASSTLTGFPEPGAPMPVSGTMDLTLVKN